MILTITDEKFHFVTSEIMRVTTAKKLIGGKHESWEVFADSGIESPDADLIILGAAAIGPDVVMRGVAHWRDSNWLVGNDGVSKLIQTLIAHRTSKRSGK